MTRVIVAVRRLDSSSPAGQNIAFGGLSQNAPGAKSRQYRISSRRIVELCVEDDRPGLSTLGLGVCQGP